MDKKWFRKRLMWGRTWHGVMDMTDGNESCEDR